MGPSRLFREPNAWSGVEDPLGAPDRRPWRGGDGEDDVAVEDLDVIVYGKALDLGDVSQPAAGCACPPAGEGATGDREGAARPTQGVPPAHPGPGRLHPPAAPPDERLVEQTPVPVGSSW